MSIYTLAIKATTTFLFCFLLVSCSRHPLKPIVPGETPMEFATAIRTLTNHLLRQVENDQLTTKKLKNRDSVKTNIVLKSFVNADTGYTVKLSKGEKITDSNTNKDSVKPVGPSIEDIILSEVQESKSCQDEFCAGDTCQKDEVIIFVGSLDEKCQRKEYWKRFENFSIAMLSQESLQQSHYIIYGVIRLETYGFDDQVQKAEKKRYHVYASVVDKQTKRVVAQSHVWIADPTETLYDLPIEVQKKSPTYLKGSGLEHLLRIVTSGRGDVVNTSSNEVDAILADANNAYEQRDYEKALQLYQKASENPNGQRKATYSGLYQTNYQLKRLKEAEVALGKLVSLGVAEKDLTFKFLFRVDAVEFGSAKKGKQETQETLEWVDQYQMWLRQLGEYFNKSNDCVDVVGYASNTGPVEYNRDLSLRRAIRIKTLLQEGDFRNIKVISTIGKGRDECLESPPKGDCRGTDDERDAYDRRVEFNVVSCGSPQ